eukprot:GFUD01043266.1.p2 GENE.GFUD01043266.1~~GFUD01043266.1.p2  ORF type:complete len:106 (+),score=31.93 GFUD01043266.1:169-486(+)
MRTILCAVLVLFTTQYVLAQRRGPPPDEEDEYAGNSVQRPNLNVGKFPFPRGETAVFNFDQGDEGFIATIPELIEGLDKIKDIMNKQRKITQAFGEAFDQCEACG